MSNIMGKSNARTMRFAGDRSGAAEIIGDILLVSMSVMMVSLLALQLSSVQNPSDTTRVDLGASYDGQNITILHMGGDHLDNSSTRFYVFVNDSLARRANITDGKSGASWRMGENWTFPFSTGASQRLRIEVIDTKNNAVILDQMLQRGPEASMLPDLGLTPNDITVLYNGHTFNDTGNPMTGDTVAINATLHNWGTAPAYNFTVRMSVYSTIDRKTYTIASSQLSLNAGSSTGISSTYTIPGGSWGMNTVSVRVVPLINETRFGNNYAVKEFRVGYLVIASHPGNPVLRIRSIESMPKYPTHGAYVNLTAHISNQGGVPANATVKYYLGSVSPANLIAQDSPVGVPVGGESLSTVVWKTPRGGLQTIIVNVTDPTGTTDQQSIQIEVMSTILLVDDDRAGEGGLKDVISSMKGSLRSAAASFTVHEVAGTGDGPLYESGDHPLKDYDLVIWMCGYENSNTLTNRDQTELTKYLNNKGRLWLIGEDILSSLRPNNNFLNNMMKVDSSTPNGYLNAGVPTSSRIIGMNIMNRTVIGMNRPFVPSGLSDRTDAMLPSTKSVAAFSEYLGQGRPVAILFNATTNGSADTYKAALFGFEPSQVTAANDRGILTYEMLRWFGVFATWGRDMAVSDQRFSRSTPAFMEDLNITVFVRNNGLNDEPVDTGRPQLQVGFYVDGGTFNPKQVTIDFNGTLTIFYPPTSEIWIPQDTTNASLKVLGGGGYIKVSMVWTADKIGQHTVVGRVDPYDYIQEISESNNEVSSVSAKTVYVRYGTLIVDDDESANNAGGHYNATHNITAAFDLLGYQYDIVVDNQNDDGPAISKMELYNAIIWCTGEESTPLTANDKTNLALFLNKGDGRNLWMIGSRVVPDGTYGQGGDAFFRDYLRVARVSDPTVVQPAIDRTPSSVEGAYLDPVAHGVRYAATPTFADVGRLVVPYVDGRGIIYQEPMLSTSVPNEMVYCDAQDGTTTGWYKKPPEGGTTSAISNVYDSSRASRVIQVRRSGANPGNPNYFMVGDYSLTINVNPNSLAWNEGQRFTAQWSFKVGVDYTFVWHVTDDLGAHHTLTYTNSNTNNLGNEPIHHGLGAFTSDGQWHTVTRDLVRDMREGGGGAGARTIKEVDGFEMGIRTGTGWVDNITLTRPFNSVRYDNTIGNFKTVFCAWDPSFISYNGNNNSIGELTYLVMGWFNMYDQRTEIRITHLDLYHGNMTPLRDMKPMIGESYMLKAKVWNPGGTRGDAVVRFSDGSTIIDSVSISVEHDSFVLAEIIWTPLYAGNRTLSVALDPDFLLDEIFKFNNGASISLQVYFFYDDMENGPNKWRHESTIVRLNGESALEYLDPGPVNTNIVGQWGQWNGFRNNTDNASLRNITSVYHSQSSAFYMHEPQAQTRTPVDVILSCDVTGSMAWDPVARIEGAKTAMMQFVNKLNSDDRGAIAEWSSYRPFSSAPSPPMTNHYTQLDQALTSNKPLMHNAIARMVVGGATPFWNAATSSFCYIRDYGSGSKVRCLVILTDGQTNSDWPSFNTARDEAYAAVTSAAIPVFAIGYGADIIPSGGEANLLGLTQRANQTGGGGGWYYFAPDAAALEGVMAKISQAIEALAQTLGRSTPESGAGARATLFSDDMEAGAGSWTTINNAPATSKWQINSDYHGSGTKAWRCYDTATGLYGHNDDDWLISPTFDATGYKNLKLSFWDRPALWRGYDGSSTYNAHMGFVFISNDNGASWYGVRAVGNNREDDQAANTAQVNGVALSVIPSTSTMKMAFRSWTDPLQHAQGWSIDDVVITGDSIVVVQPGANAYWNDGDEAPRDKSLTTATFSLMNVSSARLTFWHKYNLKVGSNGGVLMVGTAASEGGTWTYKYISPTQPYPNNLKISEWGSGHLKDGFLNDMRWCWNGMSGAGKFSWDYGEADLTQFVGSQFVRVRFQYLYCDGGTGYGWAIDDIEIKVRRSDSMNVTAASNDQWELVQEGNTYGDDYADARFAYSGRYSWWNHNPENGPDTLKGGIDNSLTSIPIDLSRAKDATLVAKLRFNFAYPEGRPPDGFRVEVSSNNGITWRQINMGIRSGWNVSGSDGAGPDGTSYTGVNLGDNWTSSNTLTRLNCDLTGWAGSVIQIRFRMVTRNDTAQHYDDLSDGFGGFFIDDVTIAGNTTTGQGRSTEAVGSGQPAVGSRDGGGQSGAGMKESDFGCNYDCRLPTSVSTADCRRPTAAVPSRRPTE